MLNNINELVENSFSDIALITNNAKVAAEIARNLNSKKTDNVDEECSGSKGRPVSNFLLWEIFFNFISRPRII